MRHLRHVVALLAVLAVDVSNGRAEQVVFSEIMFHPAAGLSEYIEICNNTATSFDIAEWRMSDGVDYVFPRFSASDPNRTFLRPYERIVLTGVDEALLRAAYGVPARIRVYGPWTGGLKESGERITLSDKNGVVVCSLKYEGSWCPAADGAGHSLVLRDPNQRIDDWRNWTFSYSRGGTPGWEELRPAQAADSLDRLSLSEVYFGSSRSVDWVEFYNSGDQTIALEGLLLSAKADLSDKVALTGAVDRRGYASVDATFPVSGGQVTIFLVNSADRVLAGRTFQRPALGDCLQAFPAGSDEWYASAVSSRDAANAPARNTDVVVNEIMYDPPSNEPCGEYMELYNRGIASVDVSGWRFVGGVALTMPAGTTIPKGGFLVVAADAEWMRATYGSIPVVGDWSGQLSNQGELVRLVDQWANLVDEVDYRPGGNWPNRANGDGSSMELRDPWMENGLASAWLDSNESDKMAFQHFSTSDVYRELLPSMWMASKPSDYRELHFYLVGDSHVILKDIQVRENGTGPNLIANGDKMSTDGRIANGWLAQGTHDSSFVEGGALHIVSEGHGDNRANRVEIDVTKMQPGRTYEVSFDARWVSGRSRLIVETWDHSIAGSLSLPVTSSLGTPGRPNSCLSALACPQLDGLMHSPAVPAPGQAVKVTVHVCSRVPGPEVVLMHRLDNVDGNGVWRSQPMADDGLSGGDESAGDGVYTATLTEYREAGQVVQFYVNASLPNGQTTTLPQPGQVSPALFVVDTTMPAGDLRRMRFVVSARDLRTMVQQNDGTPPYGYDFISNHYFNMTLVINEKDVIYGCEIRHNGSPFSRVRSNLTNRGKFKLPKDHLFRGKEDLLYRDYETSPLSHDRLVRYWLYLLGNPVNENEYVQVQVNKLGSAVREEVEPFANDLLNRIYENGSQGELYRIDDEWWFMDDWSAVYRNADWSYKGTDNPGRYRSEWMKRTRENEDDYSSLISFFKKVYVGPYTQEEIARLIDPVATMKACAVVGYVRAMDSFFMSRGKNAYFYRRPMDGRFMFFPWDCKRSFNGADQPFYGGMPGFKEYLAWPYNFRLFKHYLTRMVENYALDSARVYAWLQAEEDASSQYRFDFPYKDWFTQRQTPAYVLLGQARTAAFKVAPIATNTDPLTLSGSAPLRVFRIEVSGHPEAQFRWDDEITWTLTGIALHGGANELVVNAVDEWDTVLHQATVTVDKTGNALPVLMMNASPAGWKASVLDQVTLEVSQGDPVAASIRCVWSVTPSDASLDAHDQPSTTATFSHPGLYTFTAVARDTHGQSATIQREVAVYGPQGFSPFDGPRLEPFWNLDHVSLRCNYTTGPSYSLTEKVGSLTLQVWGDRALPLDAASPDYPVIWRPLPFSSDWAFTARLGLEGQVFGDYVTGLMAEMAEAGGSSRYAFGIEDGTSLSVLHATASGTKTVLQAVPWNVSQADLRIRRSGNTLFFEHRTSDVWTPIHSAALSGECTAVKTGLFIATDTPQSVKVAFDEAILVDPDAGP